MGLPLFLNHLQKDTFDLIFSKTESPFDFKFIKLE